MAGLGDFDRNARLKGLLADTNLLVLLIVGSVNRDRVSRFKRTTDYSPADWDLLTGILEQISPRFTIPHILAEVSALSDIKGPELETARTVLRNLIGEMLELQIPSADACATRCICGWALPMRRSLKQPDSKVAQCSPTFSFVCGPSGRRFVRCYVQSPERLALNADCRCSGVRRSVTKGRAIRELVVR